MISRKAPFPYILVYLFFVIIQLKAQGQTSNELKIIPAPPGIGDLGKYGLAKAQLSDGTFSTQIPLYQFKARNLSLPISLAYSTNGLKVDKIASRTGMDWNLVAGGSIGRMVLGGDDLATNWIQYPSDWPYTTGDSLLYVVNVTSSNAAETVPDIYNFNFNGYSGRFLYVKGRIIKLEQNSLDIQKTSNGFTVTDNNGVLYTFDIVTKSSTSSSCSGHPYLGYSDNGWLLSSIKHPSGDIIYFKYKAATFDYCMGLSQSYTGNNYNSEGSCHTCGSLYGANKCVTHMKCVDWIVDKIYSNYQGLVQFNYEARTDVPGDSAISNIQIFNVSTDRFGNSTSSKPVTPLRTIYFDYQPVNAISTYNNSESATNVSQRWFLQDLSICSAKGGNECLNYFFYYNGLDSLPQRLTYAQDHFGFFNGKSTNASLVPSPANYSDLASYNNLLAYGFGNRNPDYRYSQKGTLSKILYPTGGYDTILYEANSVYTPGRNCTNPDTTISVSASGSSNFHQSTTYNSSPFTVHCTQVVTLNLGYVETVNSYPPANYNVFASLVPVGGGTTINYDINAMQLVAGGDQHLLYQVQLNPGTYRLQLEVDGPGTGSGNFSFTDAHDSLSLEIPGLRVKEIFTYANPGKTPQITAYNYNDPSIGRSSGVAYDQTPNYQSIYTYTFNCSGGDSKSGACVFSTCYYYTYSNDNFYNLYTYTGNNIYYSDVTELSGENGENGYVEHKFDIVPDGNALPILGSLYKGAPLTNSGIYNGREFETKYYKNFGGKFKLIRDVYIHNNDDQRLDSNAIFYGFKADAGFGLGCSLDDDTALSQISNFHVAQWNMYSRWLYPDTITTTDYFDDASSITTYNASTYNNIVHQQVSQKTMLNSKGQLIIEKDLYPLDTITTTNPTALAAKSALEANHMYGSLLEQRKYNNSNLLEMDESYYYNGFSTPMPVINQHYQTISGDKEQELTVTGYDALGNIKEMKAKTGPVMSYVWDYRNTYPIAEVKNGNMDSIAFTSFEADGTGGWTVGSMAVDTEKAITGSNSHMLNSDISKSGLNSSSSFIVSYWTTNNGPFSIAGTISGYPKKGKTAGSWTYYEHHVTGQTTISISGSGRIDELRLYPVGAQMTSYTYTPLVGMTSQADVSSRITYYEYDGLQRVKRIRDQDRNILKTFDYQYMASTGCGSGCTVLTMQTFLGTATISYPVGVFSLAGNLLGNAANSSQYVTLWNNDSGDAAVGTLAAGADSMHFQFTLNSGHTLPTAITGCRYYQVDLAYNKIDGIRNINGTYVDFGDGTGMHLGATDTSYQGLVLAPNTTVTFFGGDPTPYFIHTYGNDSSQKTLTFYHNDDRHGTPNFDNAVYPATSLTLLKNLRGNISLGVSLFGGSCYQQASMSSVSNVTNWNSITGIDTFRLVDGDLGVGVLRNIAYTQDFMKNNRNLFDIETSFGPYNAAYRDTSFKLSTLKSDWNTYFLNLQKISINDDHWNREDLSALKKLVYFVVTSTTESHDDTPGSPLVPIPTASVDAILQQIMAGSGQTVSNGILSIGQGGTTRSSASDAAVAFLKAKGWTIYVNVVLQ